MSRDCPFLYWDNSIGWMGSYACKATRERIQTGSAIYEHYCHNYESSYKQCPHFRPAPDDKNCFLTSACAGAKHLPDDCRELTVLRAFRDGWLSDQPGGREEIKEYYRIAPGIVAAIHASPDRPAILEKLYDELVLPCVRLIEAGDNEAAHALYRKTVETLKKVYQEG